MKKNISLLLVLFSTFGYCQFRPYVPQNPVNAMRSVGMYKQQKYDNRKEWIQDRIYQLNDLIIDLFNDKNLPSDIAIQPTRNIYVGKIKKYTNSIAGIDFADDYQFTNIVNGYKSIENDIYSGFNSIIEQ